jgi:hypothetical protein
MTIVRGNVDPSCGRVGGKNPLEKDVGKQEGVNCGTCLRLLGSRGGAGGGGAIKTTDKSTGATINGKAIFVWDWEMFCTNSMLDVSLSAASSNAYGVVVGNSRDMVGFFFSSFSCSFFARFSFSFFLVFFRSPASVGVGIWLTFERELFLLSPFSSSSRLSPLSSLFRP